MKVRKRSYGDQTRSGSKCVRDGGANPAQAAKFVVMGLVTLWSLSASADENISIRPGYGDRWIIEDGTGRNLGTLRPLTKDTLVIEDMNGRDLGTIRDHDIDIDDLCGKSRRSVTCLFEDDEDDDRGH